MCVLLVVILLQPSEVRISYFTKCWGKKKTIRQKQLHWSCHLYKEFMYFIVRIYVFLKSYWIALIQIQTWFFLVDVLVSDLLGFWLHSGCLTLSVLVSLSICILNTYFFFLTSWKWLGFLKSKNNSKIREMHTFQVILVFLVRSCLDNDKYFSLPVELAEANCYGEMVTFSNTAETVSSRT